MMHHPFVIGILSAQVLLFGACKFSPKKSDNAQQPSQQTDKTDTTTTTTTTATTTVSVTTPPPATTPTPGTTQLAVCQLIAPTTFNAASPPAGWGETLWYDRKPTDGLTILRADGVYFESHGGNTRSGFRFDVDPSHDLSRCNDMTLKLKGAVLKQQLPGTGMDAREAPAAVVIAYIDEKGVSHSSLNAIHEGEADDRNSTRMFWRGFYTVPSPGQEEGGVKVEAGKDFDFTLDLFSLTPRPQKILWVTLEGGGWHERAGLFRSISLSGQEIPGTPVGGDQGAQPVADPCNPLPQVAFGKTLPKGWDETLWYQKRSSGGLVEERDDGVYFQSLGDNSRAGIRYDFADNDLSGCDSLTLNISGMVQKQTLAGTGIDGREAPLAVVVSYRDENGVDHTSLNAYNEGEPDDRASTRMFWRGFFITPSTGQETDGTLVAASSAINVGWNLLYEIYPRPQKLYWVTVEGGGWHERLGMVKTLSLTGVAKVVP